MTTNVNNNESVKVVVNAQVAEAMPNKAGVSYATQAKAHSEIGKRTHSLNQAVKAFNGGPFLNEPITVKDTTRTVREWLELTGVEIKNGKLTPKAVINAWVFKDEQGKQQLWRNVPCTTMAEDPKDRQRVYTYDEDKAKWVVVNRYQRVTIGEHGWTSDVILRGLLQGMFPQMNIEKGEKSIKAFDELEHLYVFDKRNDKGGVSNKAKEVSKDRVQF